MIRVRPVNAGDFDAVAALTNHFIVNTAIHFSTERVTPDGLRAAWESSRRRYPFLVAVDEHGFAGYAKAGVWRERAAYQWTPEVGIYIEERTRGRGVGKTLYRALLDEMKARGFRSAVAGITLPNEPSIRLHERVGFIKCGHVRDAGFKLGAWHDVGFWQAVLDEGPGAPAALPI